MHFTILAIAATPVDACRYFILFRLIQFGDSRLDCAVHTQEAAPWSACRTREFAALVVAYRLLDFLARVHHERTVLHHRFTQRAAREQQKPGTVGAGAHFDLFSVGQHAGGVRDQGARRGRSAYAEAALEHVDERVVAAFHRLRECGARGQLHVDVQRIGGESLDRARDGPATGLQRAGYDLGAAAARQGDLGDFLRADVAMSATRSTNCSTTSPG